MNVKLEPLVLPISKYAPVFAVFQAIITTLRSPYVVANPSVVCHLSVVCDVRAPYSES